MATLLTKLAVGALATTCRPFTADYTPSSRSFLDEAATTAKTWDDFALTPDTAVAKTRWLIEEPKLGMVDDSCLSPDFEFKAPVVGPLAKDEFINALNNFQLAAAFPDMQENYHAFRADPMERGRVWFQTRTTATHTGVETKFTGKPSGKRIEFPPQAMSVKFDDAGLVRELTVGYVIDKYQGNTGGLGGAFGFFYAVGKPLPFPECRPWKPSFQFRFFGALGKVATWFRRRGEKKALEAAPASS